MDVNIEELDRRLWLSSPAFSRQQSKHKMLYEAAVHHGRESAERYAIRLDILDEELQRLGVREVRYLTKNVQERAYYLTDKRVIYINPFFAEELSAFLLDQGLNTFTKEVLITVSILHELFHHIEELDGATDKILGERFHVRVPPIYREIAAFAFVNQTMPNMTCQLIDLYWIKKQSPAAFEVLASECNKI